MIHEIDVEFIRVLLEVVGQTEECSVDHLYEAISRDWGRVRQVKLETARKHSRESMQDGMEKTLMKGMLPGGNYKNM